MKKTFTSLALIFAGSALSASAAIIFADSVETSSTPSNGTNKNVIISSTQIGTANGEFSDALTEDNKYSVTTGSSYNFNGSAQYLSDHVNGHTFTFAFNNPQTIAEVLIWNYSQNEIRGLKGIDKVEVYANGAWTDAWTGFTLDPAGDVDFKAQVIDISYGTGAAGAWQDVEQVRLTVIQGDTGNGEDAGGFDKVAFSSIPEPSVALLGGLGLLGLLRRRR